MNVMRLEERGTECLARISLTKLVCEYVCLSKPYKYLLTPL